jgi:hypothetical protein
MYGVAAPVLLHRPTLICSHNGEFRCPKAASLPVNHQWSHHYASNVGPVLGCQSPDANRLACHCAIRLGCTSRCRKSNQGPDRLGGALGGLKSSHCAAGGVSHGPSGALFMELRMIFRAALCGIASLLRSQERMRPHGARSGDRRFRLPASLTNTTSFRCTESRDAAPGGPACFACGSNEFAETADQPAPALPKERIACGGCLRGREVTIR